MNTNFMTTKSVEFSSIDTDVVIPKSEKEFFTEFLKIQSEDQFQETMHASIRKAESLHQHFEQYYKGVKVPDFDTHFLVNF